MYSTSSAFSHIPFQCHGFTKRRVEAGVYRHLPRIIRHISTGKPVRQTALGFEVFTTFPYSEIQSHVVRGFGETHHLHLEKHSGFLIGRFSSLKMEAISCSEADYTAIYSIRWQLSKRLPVPDLQRACNVLFPS
jgi:hypothetical protein